jgi:amino acid permease
MLLPIDTNTALESVASALLMQVCSSGYCVCFNRSAALLGLLVFIGTCAILCLRLPRLAAEFTSGSASAGGGMATTAASGRTILLVLLTLTTAANRLQPHFERQVPH